MSRSGIPDGGSGARCREGHVSDEPDYCSVCGVAMSAAGAPPPAQSTALPPLPARNTPLPASVRRGLPTQCPSCGEPRTEPDARFCEVCRFDFVAGKPGPPPVGATSARPSAAPAANTPPRTPTGSFELVITVDASLDTEPDPDSPCPQDIPPVTVPLDKPELLVGRHDARRDIHPELPVFDPGASRRHAKFVVAADGGIALLDLASTNGTKLNGVDVAPGSRTVLTAGDAVTLGRWTRITLRGRP